MNSIKDNNPENQHPTMTSSILSAAQKQALALFNESNDNRLLYHTFERTNKVAEMVQKIANGINASEDVQETALLAAWFHTTGFLTDYNQGESKSIELAEAFLKKESYPAEKIKRVLIALEATRPGQSPSNEDQQLLMDGINAYNASVDFFEQRPLLRLEWELMQNRRISNIEWNQTQLQYLLKTKFSSAFAKLQFEPSVAQNILDQKTRVEKDKRNKFQLIDQKEGELRKFQGLEKRLPGDATQTFFRANYRNHINLSNIADNKANIMISVNAILISVVISILSYRNIPETNPMVLLPVVIFLVTGLTSLIFAVLSIRPKVTSLNQGEITPEQAKKNIVFFGNFVTMTIDQYEEAVDAVLRDGELLYGNMVRDLYYLGKVLDKKYRFLTLSYNIFMGGFVLTVVTFLTAIFM